MSNTTSDKECTVMIVDDSVFMRQMLRTMLESSGCKVIAEATDGDEAVVKFAENMPSIIFMDVVMPNVSGIDATKQILSIDRKAKVVMCSSLGHEDLIKAALDSGARDVAFKPYKIQQLHEVLLRVMQY